MITRSRPDVADRRDAADREAGQVVRLARGRPADVGLAGHRGQAGEVDPVGPGHEAEQRLGAVVAVGTTKTSDLTIWPSSAPSGGGRLGGGVGRLGEAGHLERHALAGGRVEDALDRGMDGGLGHGRSLASGRSRGCRAG